MNEQSLMKRSLVLTAKLLGVFTLWTVVLSLVVVGLTSRAVGALSGSPEGSSQDTVDARAKDKAGASRGATSNQNVIRPNG